MKKAILLIVALTIGLTPVLAQADAFTNQIRKARQQYLRKNFTGAIEALEQAITIVKKLEWEQKERERIQAERRRLEEERRRLEAERRRLEQEKRRLAEEERRKAEEDRRRREQEQSHERLGSGGVIQNVQPVFKPMGDSLQIVLNRLHTIPRPGMKEGIAAVRGNVTKLKNFANGWAFKARLVCPTNRAERRFSLPVSGVNVDSMRLGVRHRVGFQVQFNRVELNGVTGPCRVVFFLTKAGQEVVVHRQRHNFMRR